MGLNTLSSKKSDIKAKNDTCGENSIPVLVDKLNELQLSWISDLTYNIKE